MSSKTKLEGDIIGVDLGMSRTGVARLHTTAQIAEPLAVIDMKEGLLVDQIQAVIDEHQACALIAGVPRGLDGQHTEQTIWAEKIIEELRNAVTVPVYSIDEAGTTKQAEERAHENQSIDSVAAGILVEDFISEVASGRIKNVIL